jgi:hypothetical protein
LTAEKGTQRRVRSAVIALIYASSLKTARRELVDTVGITKEVNECWIDH